MKAPFEEVHTGYTTQLRLWLLYFSLVQKYKFYLGNQEDHAGQASCLSPPRYHRRVNFSFGHIIKEILNVLSESLRD